MWIVSFVRVNSTDRIRLVWVKKKEFANTKSLVWRLWRMPSNRRLKSSLNKTDNDSDVERERYLDQPRSLPHPLPPPSVDPELEGVVQQHSISPNRVSGERCPKTMTCSETYLSTLLNRHLTLSKGLAEMTH